MLLVDLDMQIIEDICIYPYVTLFNDTVMLTYKIGKEQSSLIFSEYLKNGFQVNCKAKMNTNYNASKIVHYKWTWYSNSKIR